MNEIVFVTSNLGKIKSAQKYFDTVELIPYNYKLSELRSDDIEEIAINKVKQAYAIVRKPCIALDAGFYIDKLNGFPRSYVNFALETLGVEGILKLRLKQNKK
ncbi:MAG: non-canonical purine NTP pyrophosphatase [Bacilli bacterium]|jgi:XTP/dITP diphosphohydrolase